LDALLARQLRPRELGQVAVGRDAVRGQIEVILCDVQRVAVERDVVDALARPRPQLRQPVVADAEQLQPAV